MKAIGLYKYLPINHEESLLNLEIDKPSPIKRELLVKIHAISVNPIDTKIRAPKEQIEETPKILGWDAVGMVEDTGEDCTLFKQGDYVYYAGSITKQGANSEYHIVDERIVAKKPETLSDAEAAALPLTAITAWEGLFERLAIDLHGNNEGKTILIIGGAGGVGSICIQLAKLAGLTVIATASRQETIDWCKQLGADYIINHYKPFTEQLRELNINEVDYIYCLNNTDQHWNNMADTIKPQGKICSIVATEANVDLNLLKNKSVTFVWELMFTKAMYETEDMETQHQLLCEVAKFIDEGKLKTTLTTTMSPINAENLKKAHQMIESGKTIGKIVLERFE
ncbi:zinc-binding alcohol dehydrogenase family protein [Bacillus manliponensis]|uniref:zinc-binding alcohol dehydrogenase family protein n=1 Tax=Bacillus manliponensis TaxID=574376 RepID=UPI0035156D57